MRWRGLPRADGSHGSHGTRPPPPTTATPCCSPGWDRRLGRPPQGPASRVSAKRSCTPFHGHCPHGCLTGTMGSVTARRSPHTRLPAWGVRPASTAWTARTATSTGLHAIHYCSVCAAVSIPTNTRIAPRLPLPLHAPHNNQQRAAAVAAWCARRVPLTAAGGRPFRAQQRLPPLPS